jgi:sugar-specific transcriptional regulator TrmB
MCPTTNDEGEKCDESNITRVLRRLGLTHNQVKLYIIALKEGPIPIGRLAKESGIHRANAYRIVDHLKEMGLIELMLNGVNKVKAVDVKEALDILITRQEERLDSIRKYKSSMNIEGISPLIEDNSTLVYPQKMFARLLIGKHTYVKLGKLVQECKEEIIQVVSAKGFLFQTNIGLTDMMVNKARKDGVKIRMLTEADNYNFNLLLEFSKDIEIRHRANLVKMLRYIIIDRKQLILKMAAPPRFLDQSVALWSNSTDLIKGLYYEFKRLWSKSTSLSNLKVSHSEYYTNL